MTVPVFQFCVLTMVIKKVFLMLQKIWWTYHFLLLFPKAHQFSNKKWLQYGIILKSWHWHLWHKIQFFETHWLIWTCTRKINALLYSSVRKGIQGYLEGIHNFHFSFNFDAYFFFLLTVTRASGYISADFLGQIWFLS